MYNRANLLIDGNTKMVGKSVKMLTKLCHNLRLALYSTEVQRAHRSMVKENNCTLSAFAFQKPQGQILTLA